ncbi:hypothetical protein K7432_012654 [Basidiobolus ranarum]|uniref:Uncharacterized protein n=1 Tax=Basidiobolus ranarum TaxID=34480 RepID=A0ABR2WKI3_9FUNG
MGNRFAPIFDRLEPFVLTPFEESANGAILVPTQSMIAGTGTSGKLNTALARVALA